MTDLEFDPPIPNRNTNELIEIANNPEKWNRNAIELAQVELSKRGITLEQQEEKIIKWNKRKAKRHQKEMASRAIESYGAPLLIWMTIRWPYTVFDDWYLKSDGYIRMHKERLISIFAGIILYISFGLLSLSNQERSQQPWQNEVNRQDIYEWEREYYTDEELKKLRRESIERVIQKVRKNIKEDIPTVVILDSDTISNSSIERLHEIDPLIIRDVIFQADYEPHFHEWIVIKLIK